MKISNILFIGFFAFLTLISLSFLIPANEDDVQDRRHGIEYVGHKFDVPNFKYLKVQKDCRVRIFSANSDTCRLFVRQPKDSLVIAPEFFMSGDTLIVTSTRAYNNNEVQLYCGDISSIEAFGKVYINSKQQNFDIASFGGRVVLEAEQKANNVEFTGENCEFVCRSNDLKHCKVELHNSKFECYANALQSMQIIAKGNSNIKTRTALKMAMDREPSTTFTSIR